MPRNFHHAIVVLFLGVTTTAIGGPTLKARTIWERIVGGIAPGDAAKIALMVDLVKKGKVLDAADIAISEKRFIDTTIRQFATPWTNRPASPAFPYNGMVALVQGVVRDGILGNSAEGDFRRAFFGDFQYRVKAAYSPPALSPSDETHFDVIVAQNLSPYDVLELKTPQWGDDPNHPRKKIHSGMMTVDAAKFLYDAGTNRRPVEWLFRHAACLDMTQVHDVNGPDQMVSQDVDRDNPQTYQTRCIGCHRFLDSMRPAFAYVDALTNGGVTTLTFLTSVSFKYTNNATVFPDGYVVTNDMWENLATINQNSSIGWRGATEGQGIPEIAQMFTNSQAFSRCMAEQVWKTVCLRSPTDAEKAAVIRRLGNDFEDANYRLHLLFKAVAAEDACSGPAKEEAP